VCSASYVRGREKPTVVPFSFVRYKARLVVIGLAVLLCAIASCGGPSRDIVGKWRTSVDANALVWEFSENGSILIGNTRGRYSFGDNNRIKIETPFATSVYQMEFWGDRMILRNINGSRLEFTRIR
jgi:hypothetical protein